VLGWGLQPDWGENFLLSEGVEQPGEQAAFAFHLRSAVTALAAAQPGIEQVSERVSEHVGAPDDDEQAKPWPERQRRNPLHVAASFPTEHPSLAGNIGGQPKTKEAQGGLGNDHVANGHGEDDDHGRHDVGQHMPEEDLMHGNAHGPSCQEIDILLDADDRAPASPA
jgi:hypothetical protein